MAEKKNIRSFRYSDKVLEVLMKQEGNSLNDKFERLVLLCNDMVPQRKKEVKEWEKRIQLKRQEYQRACERFNEINEVIRSLETLKYYAQAVAGNTDLLKKHLKEDGNL